MSGADIIRRERGVPAGAVDATSKREGRSGPELCQAFNAKRGKLRRLFKASKSSEPVSLLNQSECRALIPLPSGVQHCPFGGGALTRGVSAELLPTNLEGIQSVQWWEDLLVKRNASPSSG